MAVSIKTKKKSVRRPRRSKGRDERGRFLPGFSGNLKGRPRNKAELPKHLVEQLADAMAEKIAFADPDGKEKVLPVYEVATLQLARSVATAKPKEIMSILEWMEKLCVFAVMRERAGPPPEKPVSDEDLQLLAMIKEKLGESGLAEMFGRKPARDPGRARDARGPRPGKRPRGSHARPGKSARGKPPSPATPRRKPLAPRR